MRNAFWMRMLLIGSVALLVAACASIGRPEGGPRDEVPPEFVRSTPAPGSVGVERSRIDIFFDENIKLEDPSNKIVISPAQKQSPSISSNGRRVSVELRDTLLPNTTYTFDFSDAIRDLNEGNILDGFAVDFATGAEIDTLRISGMVFQARNLEPAQGMVVGVYSNLEDSALRKLPMERVAKTNQYGQFTIRGLKPGVYNVFAVDDRNHDWHWDRSENIAFYPVTVSPQAERIELTDTLLSADGKDSLAVREATRFLPDDVLLTWFNEDYKPYYLRDYKRPVRRMVTFLFGATPDSMPALKVVSGPMKGRSLSDPAMSVLERREQGDSLVFWLREPQLVATDSLFVEARYQKTDTLDMPVWQTDTLKLFFREPKGKKKKDKEKEEGDTLGPEPVFMTLKSLTSGQQELDQPLRFEASEPMDSFPNEGVRLEMAVDSLWEAVPFTRPFPDSLSSRFWTVPVEWKEGMRYRFSADSLAFRNIYGEGTKPINFEFSTRQMADYGTLKLSVTDIPYDSVGPLAVVVELLDNQDKVVKTSPALPGQGAMFTHLLPGVYYARAFIDLNGNGVWDRGDMASRLLPEEVFYYPKKFNVRKNWDIAQDWAMFELPVDMQKPDDIKKNKPKTKEPGRKNGRDSDDEEEDEFEDGNSWGNGSQYNNARRGSSSGRFTGGAGMQTVRTQR